MAPPSRGRRLARRVVPVGSILVAVLAVGVGAWWASARTPVVSAVITRPAPELGPRAHVLLPDLVDAEMVVPDRPHDPAEVRAADRFAKITRRRSFRVSTNSRGLRAPEIDPHKGAARVVALGDSVTFGWGVPVEDSYPAQLSDRLGIEVINTGVPAMKPGSMAAWARLHLADLQPDLVLFTRRPDHGVPDPWGDFQRAVRQVQQAARPAPVAVVMPPVSTFDPRGARGWEEERRRVAELVAPVPVLDLTPAFRKALPRPGVVLEQHGGRQQVVRLPGAEVVVDVAAPADGLAPQVVAAFEADPDLAEPLFFDGGHPDAAGFVLFADAVAEFIRDERLLR